MLILLAVSGVEIFFNVITNLVNRVVSLVVSNFKLEGTGETTIKLINVIVFLISVIYFLVKGVGTLATILGIPLDKSLFEIFR